MAAPINTNSKQHPVLSILEREWAVEFVSTGNATEAFRRVFGDEGWSAIQVRNEIQRLKAMPIMLREISRLRNFGIGGQLNDKIAEVQERSCQVLERYAVTQERILRELALIGFARMSDFMSIGEDGLPVLDFSNLSEEQSAAVAEVTVDTLRTAVMTDEESGGTVSNQVLRVRFKLHNKVDALVKLGQCFGMFKDDGKNKTGMVFDGQAMQVPVNDGLLRIELVRPASDCDPDTGDILPAVPTGTV